MKEHRRCKQKLKDVETRSNNVGNKLSDIWDQQKGNFFIVAYVKEKKEEENLIFRKIDSDTKWSERNSIGKNLESHGWSE